MKKQILSILKNVNKPSRYIGQEVGSFNKNWDLSAVKAVLAFPDLYEIGISNLGLRILYDKINNYKEKVFLADRVYAPEIDFKNQLKENNIPLYGVESFKPVKDFDLMAFSLQYELSYPTILAMFDMSGIPIKSADRDESHPIVAAGGPGSYNPLPISEFIDVFIIGDGESVIIEIMEEISSAKINSLSRKDILTNLSKMNGVYVPSIGASTVSKRIDDIDNTDYPVKFPVPYSQAVHDRAVIEIRRGCGRMCRFCQPCFVNLPVRERSAHNVVELTDNILKNTGYDEYSLLSLSSNDYKNIEHLVKTLNDKHACTGASVSLPSQRADKFSLELAQLVQSVRKSTITFAPEAGSQRLRDVINKNLTESQILDAVLSAYKAGWHAVKLYFMIGLPTETIDDLEEIVNLLKKIKDAARSLKNEMGLRKYLSLTCTISIYVPKPFTPFQWWGQDTVQAMNEKIRYLRDRTKPIKDVKLNFHDSFLSQLEAVFSRGDSNLNKLIEKVYEDGSYLDAWREHFNKELWINAAEAVNINLEDYACKKFELDEQLYWDFIDVGVDKQWLKEEYKAAMDFKNSIPCDETCSTCGVCENFNVSPSLKSHLQILPESNDNTEQNSLNSPRLTGEKGKPHNKQVSKYRIKLQKVGDLRFISHLDWQKLFYSAVRKSGIKINFSEGFNPSPKISLAVALPIFVEGKEEFAEIELLEELKIEEIKDKINEFLPENSKILEIVKISKDIPSVEKTVAWAKYCAMPTNFEIFEKFNIKSIVKNHLLKENIIIEKHSNKKESKQIDIRPAIHSLIVDESNGQQKLVFIIRTSNSDGTLRADVFLENLLEQIDESNTDSLSYHQNDWHIVREKLLNNEFNELF